MKDFLHFTGRSFLLLIMIAFVGNLFTPIPAIAGGGGAKVCKTEKDSLLADIASMAVFATRKDEDTLSVGATWSSNGLACSAHRYIMSIHIKPNSYSHSLNPSTGFSKNHRKTRRDTSHLCSIGKLTKTKILIPPIQLRCRSNC